MPLKTSEAFIIDVRKLQEADRLVVFFTEDEGKQKGVAASAARSRKRFGGCLERLSRVRITYFEKEGRELCRVDSCDLLEESFTLHQDLRKAALLSYLAEIVDTFAHEREADPKTFRLLRSVITALRDGADPAVLARYFEVWNLSLHGLLPDLGRCGECGRDLASLGATVVTGDTPHALCSACGSRGIEPGPQRQKLSSGAIGLLASFRRLPPGRAAASNPEPGVVREVERVAVSMTTAFVGHPFRSYGFLKEVSDA